MENKPEAKLYWQRPGLRDQFADGDKYLVAIQTLDRWEYEIVTVNCDEHYFNVTGGDGETWGYEWSDVCYYIQLSEFILGSPKFIEDNFVSLQHQILDMSAKLDKLRRENQKLKRELSR